MPFIPTNPETKSVAVTSQENHAINEINIVAHAVLTPVDADPSIQIEWVYGYRDTGGAFVETDRRSRAFTFAEIGPAIAVQVTAGKTRYQETKAGLYQLLVDHGELVGSEV